MKKLFAIKKPTLCTMLLIIIFVIPFAAKSYAADSSVMYSKTVNISSGDKKVTYVIVDLNRPEIKVHAITAKNQVGATDSIDRIAALAGSSEQEVVAAINGTYFSAYDNNPLPWGTLQKNGKVIHIGNSGATIGFTKDNQVKVENLYTSVEGYINDVYQWYAWNINHTYDREDAIVILTPEFGAQTHDHSFTSIIVDNGKVTEIKAGPGIIPSNGYVIVTGYQDIISRFKVGDDVAYKTLFNRIDFSGTSPQKGNEITWDNIWTAVGAGPTLLKDGKIVADGASEGFIEDKINMNKAQRSFIGVTTDNKLVMGTVPSVSIQELAQIAQKLGLVHGINLDGGASSGLYYKGKTIHKPGRLLSNAIVITSQKQNKVPAENIRVKVNGTDLDFDQPPVIINNRTMVPLRAIFEALGAEIKWDDKTQTVTGKKGEITVELKIGNNIAKLNEQNLSLDVPAMIVNKRTVVPARFIAECLGARVEWDSNSKTVMIQEP